MDELASLRRLRLGQLLDGASEAESAESAFREVMVHGQPSHRPEAACGLGMLLKRTGRIDEARLALNFAAESAIPRWAGWGALNLGHISELQEDYPSAQAAYERLVDAEDEDVRADALARLGLLLFRFNDPRAEATLRRAIAVTGTFGSRQASINLAVLQEQSDRTDEAVDLYQRVAASGDYELSPKAMVNLGLLFNRLGHGDRARQCFTQALASRHPRHACNAAVNLCDMERSEGRPASALDFLKLATEFEQSEYKAELSLRMGDLLSALGRLTESRHAYLQVVESGDPTFTPIARGCLAALPEA